MSEKMLPGLVLASIIMLSADIGGKEIIESPWALFLILSSWFCGVWLGRIIERQKREKTK